MHAVTSLFSQLILLDIQCYRQLPLHICWRQVTFPLIPLNSRLISHVTVLSSFYSYVHLLNTKLSLANVLHRIARFSLGLVSFSHVERLRKIQIPFFKEDERHYNNQSRDSNDQALKRVLGVKSYHRELHADSMRRDE
jgi:hypothetical protein